MALTRDGSLLKEVFDLANLTIGLSGVLISANVSVLSDMNVSCVYGRGR